MANLSFEPEIANNDSYEKFSKYKSNPRNNDIENYVSHRPIQVAGVTRTETRDYSDNERSDEEMSPKIREKPEKHSRDNRNRYSKNHDIENNVEDMRIADRNDENLRYFIKRLVS